MRSEQSLAEQPSFLGDKSEGDGVVVEDLHSMFTVERLQSRHLRLSRLWKSCLVQHLSSHETYRHRSGPSRKQYRLSS